MVRSPFLPESYQQDKKVDIIKAISSCTNQEHLEKRLLPSIDVVNLLNSELAGVEFVQRFLPCNRRDFLEWETHNMMCYSIFR